MTWQWRGLQLHWTFCSPVIRWIVLLSVAELCVGCTFEQVEHCTRALKPYDFKSSSSVIFPWYPDNSLAVICGSYVEMEKCLKPVRKDCDIVGQAHFRGTEAAARFLCEDGKEEYRRQRDCFLQPRALDVARHCNQTYADNLQTLRLQKDSTLKERKSQLCRYMEDQVDCLRDGMSMVCGQEAANWLHTMEKRILAPHIQEMECFRKDKRLGVPAIFGIMFAIFTFIMSVIFGIVLCQKHKGRSSYLRPANKSKPRSGQRPKHKMTAEKSHAMQPLMSSKNPTSSQQVNGPGTTPLTVSTTVGDNGEASAIVSDNEKTGCERSHCVDV